MTRLRARSLAFDAALTALLATAGVLEAVTHGDGTYLGTASPLVAGTLVVVGALPLAFRRIRPIPVLVAVGAFVALPHLLVSYDLVFVGGFCPLLVAVETVGRYTRRPLHRSAR